MTSLDSMMNHLPECAVAWIRECICKELQMAYNRGKNDTVLSIIDMVTYRVDVLSFCNNNDDCNAMAKGAGLVLSDIEYYMERHNDTV